MLIAQITDVHVGFDLGNPDESNTQRLKAVVRQLIDGANQPDLLIVSGDLADHGDVESYRRCADILRTCPFPVHVGLGNHDDRASFAETFPVTPFNDGFAQYCVELDGLRLIMLDTLEVGRHGGGFCDVRANWLRVALAEDCETPTVIVMHHPPLDIGIAWMATLDDEPWVQRFASAIEGHSQIKAIWCGHFHRPIAALWRGIQLTVCPASSAQLALDLRPIDAEQADDRAIIVDDPPGLMLHLWRDGQLTSHFDTVIQRTVLAKFDRGMQPLLQHLAEERNSAGGASGH